jgi:hypothetical protein
VPKQAALPDQVRNLGAPVELAGRYFAEGADELTFLNITGFRDFPLGDLPMLEVWPCRFTPRAPPACQLLFSMLDMRALYVRVWSFIAGPHLA